MYNRMRTGTGQMPKNSGLLELIASKKKLSHGCVRERFVLTNMITAFADGFSGWLKVKRKNS